MRRKGGKRRVRRITVEGGKLRSTCSQKPGSRARREREENERQRESKRERKREKDDVRPRERAEKRQREKERGPGASPPSLLLREGGSSESIRTVSPADTHPRPPHPPVPLSPLPRRPVRRLVRGTPTGRPTTFSAAPQFSPLFPFITARWKSGWVDPGGGSGHLYFSPTLHLDLLFLHRLLLSSPPSTGVGPTTSIRLASPSSPFSPSDSFLPASLAH